MKSALWALIVVALFGCASQANASLLLYTDQFTGSGSLGTTNFTNQLVTVSFLGDPANVVLTPVGSNHFYSLATGVPTVNIAGVGTATFTDSMEVLALDLFTSPPGLAEIGDLTSGATWGTKDPIFVSYNLASPISVTSTTLNTGSVGHTNLGDFTLTSSSTSSTFAATAVPEPGGLALLGIAFAGLVAFRRVRPA